jgi:NAD(P)-dependent dehydrogenase (short-subunit alcohol dehydrogenase family)
MGKLPSLTLVWDCLPLWPAITGAHLLLQTRNGSSDDPPASPPLELKDPASQRAPSPQGWHKSIRSKSSGIIVCDADANRSAYSATKWALIGFTNTLSIELSEFGIRANAILPGAAEGPRIQRVIEDRAKLSGKRSARYCDISGFLASNAGKSISGAVLPIDNDTQKAS